MRLTKNRYRVRKITAPGLWIAQTSTKQYVHNGAHFNYTRTPSKAWSYRDREKAEVLLKRCIENHLEHYPTDHRIIYEIEEYQDS